MKRRVDVCLGCPRLIVMHKERDGSVAGAFCCPVQFSSDICRFWEDEVGLKLKSMRAEDSAMMGWDELDVPFDCDRYEHYFLLECNK